MLNNDEFIYNWSNLRHSNQGERLACQKTAQKLRTNGYTADEAIDVLLGDKYSLSTAEDIVNAVYAKRDEDGTVISPARQAFVAPRNYEEMIPMIEDSLTRLSATEFTDKLAMGASPLMPISKKQRDSLERLAERAKKDREARLMLHDDLKPFLANALYNAVLTAQSPKCRIAMAGKRDDRVVLADGDRVASVNLESGQCSCPRYRDGNYADFGVSCEHIVYIDLENSPNARLMRALVD